MSWKTCLRVLFAVMVVLSIAAVGAAPVAADEDCDEPRVSNPDCEQSDDDSPYPSRFEIGVGNYQVVSGGVEASLNEPGAGDVVGGGGLYTEE